MDTVKFIGKALGWLVTILAQIAVSFFIIFVFSVIFAGADSKSRLGWLALLFVIWLSYVIGINLAGQQALRWAWKDAQPLLLPRVVGTMTGAGIMLLILLVIGYSVPFGTEGSRFESLISNNWQPTMAQASLFAGLVGFYVPGIRTVQGLVGIQSQE